MIEIKEKEAIAKVERALKIAKAIRGGKTYEQVGEEFGISKQRIHQILKSANLVKGYKPIEAKSDLKLPPLPSRAKYPWRTMKIGQYFDVPPESAKNIRQHAWTMGKATGRSFSCRRYEHGIRVWRIL